MPPKARPLADRLWERVDREEGPSECWPWIGGKDREGYGRFVIHVPKRLDTRSHRVAWMVTNGPIPDGLLVLHKCDNPPCCNPNHLYLGTFAQNMHDCVERRRHPELLKTHCPQGHPYDEQNTTRTGGRRHCRACSRERSRKWRADT